MLKVKVEGDAIGIGSRFSVAFQRTLRIPDDGKTYPLPPGLGRLPICRVKDFAARVPAQWREGGGVFIPMYQREALWLAFDGASWKPNAVQIGIGKVNVISGAAWQDQLVPQPQNYIVCPDQLWLDGINAGEGHIRQFVAMPLGQGYTVEVQLTGKEDIGGIQLRVFEPKPGRFPDKPPRASSPGPGPMKMAAPRSVGAMGLGAGGKMRQSIYPDSYGIDTWDADNAGEVFIHIVNSAQYQDITGRAPPPCPIDAKTYTQYGFPWFELYDEDRGDVPASKSLSEVKSINQQDAEKGKPSKQETVEVTPGQVKKIKRSRE
jgi:hypothetical protein